MNRDAKPPVSVPPSTTAFATASAVGAASDSTSDTANDSVTQPAVKRPGVDSKSDPETATPTAVSDVVADSNVTSIADSVASPLLTLQPDPTTQVGLEPKVAAKPHTAPDPDRRQLLRNAALLGGTAVAAQSGIAAAVTSPDPVITEIQDWNRYLGEGVDARPYGTPSQYEADVVRRDVSWLTADAKSSVNFTPLHELDGIITPNGLCFERHHAGIAEINPDDHRLMINGLVDTPLVFTLEDLRRFPRVNRVYFLECAANSGMEWRGAQLNGCQFTHGMVHNVMYTGVQLSTILREAGLKSNAKWLLPEGGDASHMTRSVPVEKALNDCLVVTHMNGEALRPEQGYPLRLVVPGWEGNMWVKWLRRIEVGDKPWHQREETSKYTDLLEDGFARRFTWEMDVKSVVTSPSPQSPINHGRGQTVITGLAWSGFGKVKRVDISIDGGRNWTQARLDGPSWSKSVHRFYYDFNWDGKEMLLQSRAVDEIGRIQPTKHQLRQARGENSIYHNNGIQTWHVKADGSVENVEIS